MKSMWMIVAAVIGLAGSWGSATRTMGPLWAGPTPVEAWVGIPKAAGSVAVVVAAPKSTNTDPRWEGYYQKRGAWQIRVRLDGQREVTLHEGQTDGDWTLQEISLEKNKPAQIILNNKGKLWTLTLEK